MTASGALERYSCLAAAKSPLPGHPRATVSATRCGIEVRKASIESGIPTPGGAQKKAEKKKSAAGAGRLPNRKWTGGHARTQWLTREKRHDPVAHPVRSPPAHAAPEAVWRRSRFRVIRRAAV